MKQDRMKRVNHSIQRVLADLFEAEIAPRVDVLVTVTRVRVAPDLRTAKVFVSTYGTPSQQNAAMAVVAKQRALLQQGLARAVRIKYTPVLEFIPDDTFAEADRIISLLDKLAPAEGPPSDPKPGAC
ncbi:MAG: 30S ribosome-binding factor RbfA [Kiritimatiellaeota bacterium]|nr:30S ribosome-binding factor RbfA [Kiritimatiellota bacterium]